MTGFVGAGVLKDFRNDAVNSLINASPEYIKQCNYGDLMAVSYTHLADIKQKQPCMKQ